MSTIWGMLKVIDNSLLLVSSITWTDNFCCCYCTSSAIVWGYFGTGIRLRKASNIRNHQSPVDFITDRFQSQFLRYTIVTLQVVPAVIYLAPQVAAIKVSDRFRWTLIM
jgi:Na+/proline symporter